MYLFLLKGLYKMCDITLDCPLVLKIIRDAQNEKKYLDEPRTKYKLTIFDTENDYNIYHNNEINNNFDPYNQIDVDEVDGDQLWEYAYLLFDNEIDTDTYILKDMTYQEFANISKCKIVIKVNINDITSVTPKIYNSSEKKNNIILIEPPAINTYEEYKNVTRPSCIANFLHDGDGWYIKRKTIKRKNIMSKE